MLCCVFVIRTQTAVHALSSVSNRKGLNPGQDSRWQQSGTSHIFINAIHWPHRPYSAPWWFDRVGNKQSMKADLAIYTYMLGISTQCKSVSLKISNKLDCISCAVRDGFCKSSHIKLLRYVLKCEKFDSHFLNQVCTGHRPTFAWFLKIAFVWTAVCVCLCVCVSTPEAINN